MAGVSDSGRDVSRGLRDAFDLDALLDVLREIAAGRIAVRVVETSQPTVCGQLQFGFVMDWLYGDDTPRAERRQRCWRSIGLLDDVMLVDGPTMTCVSHR